MKNIAVLVGLGVLAFGCTTSIASDDESIKTVDETVTPSCDAGTGLLPTKAGLAVAMANELKRWDAVTDLTRTGSNGIYQVALSAAGLKQCSDMGSTCANTKALLALQDISLWQVINPNTFNPTAYREDLLASFARQQDRINDLKMNNPSQVPAPHKLTKVGGPTNLGSGACGPHWVYKPTSPSGGTYSTPANLANSLYFFGHPNNDFLSFTVTNGNVAVDPFDGDNAPPITSTGSCPTYDLDRVYNPTNSLLGTCCVTIHSLNGALQALPRGGGFIGCRAGVVPTR